MHNSKSRPLVLAVAIMAIFGLAGCSGSNSGQKGSSNWDELIWGTDKWA